MYMTTFSIFLSCLIPMLIILITLIISSRSIIDREKSSPFECGFDPKNSARIPFSLRFFLLAVIFLVFDIEIALLLPIPMSLKAMFSLSALYSAFIFTIILILGLLHEWKEGSLEWAS